MKNFILTLTFIIFSLTSMAELSYMVSFQDAKEHYAQISITFKPSSKTSHLKVPVWTPGSYKVREFSRHYDVQGAEQNGVKLNLIRIDKNTWEIEHQGDQQVTVTYRLYAFTISCRESYVDEYYAFLHGPSAFAYIEEHMAEKIVLEVQPYSGWKNVEIAVPSEDALRYEIENYDLLADSPLACGNFDVSSFESGKTPHKIVMIGKGNYDLNRVTEDIKTICDEEVKIFGEHPSDLYVHFIMNTTAGSGGLEHLNCQTSDMYRWGYNDEERYKRFLGLISHEYFHLWNVKRIRPAELGPFNYDEENYTKLLWVAEGLTSYYDDLTLFRAGIIDQKEYFKLVSAQITRYENTPGKDQMTLEESSQLAWIKGYLPDENSSNTSISYYNKGMIVAWMLDLKIIESTNGEKRLDDVLRALYQMYKSNPETGFTYDEFKAVCNEVSGTDLNPLFELLVESTTPIDYSEYLQPIGLTLNMEVEGTPWSGITSTADHGSVIVRKIHRGSPAAEGGISVNDEILAVNGWRLSTQIELNEVRKQVGDTLNLLVSRDGQVYEKTLILGANPTVSCSLQLAEGVELSEYWLRKD